jgi:hypothetical protein
VIAGSAQAAITKDPILPGSHNIQNSFISLCKKEGPRGAPGSVKCTAVYAVSASFCFHPG